MFHENDQTDTAMSAALERAGYDLVGLQMRTLIANYKREGGTLQPLIDAYNQAPGPSKSVPNPEYRRMLSPPPPPITKRQIDEKVAATKAKRAKRNREVKEAAAAIVRRLMDMRKTSEGFTWASVPVSNYAGMKRDGNMVWAIEQVHGPYNAKEARLLTGDTLTDEQFKRACVLAEERAAA